MRKVNIFFLILLFSKLIWLNSSDIEIRYTSDDFSYVVKTESCHYEIYKENTKVKIRSIGAEDYQDKMWMSIDSKKAEWKELFENQFIPKFKIFKKYLIVLDSTSIVYNLPMFGLTENAEPDSISPGTRLHIDSIIYFPYSSDNEASLFCWGSTLINDTEKWFILNKVNISSLELDEWKPITHELNSDFQILESDLLFDVMVDNILEISNYTIIDTCIEFHITDSLIYDSNYMITLIPYLVTVYDYKGIKKIVLGDSIWNISDNKDTWEKDLQELKKNYNDKK